MLAQLAVAVFLYMSLGFGVSLALKRNDIADIFWGLGFVFLALLSLGWSLPLEERTAWVVFMVILWAARLSGHIALRNRGKTEDFRYKAWREQWGKTFYWRSFLQVWMLQGFFMLIIASPVCVAILADPLELGWIEYIGAMIWAFGFWFEAVADLQLMQFKSRPENRGKFIQSGLWSFSRHPNYFGEALVWWGVFLFALRVPYGWMTVMGPALLTYLLRYVSGVPMLERKYEGNPEFESYKARVPAFVPNFRR